MTRRQAAERPLSAADEPGGAGGLARTEPATPVDQSGVLAAAAQGDEDAWRALIGMYSRRVFAMARSRVGSAELAEEITQSVFVTLARTLKGGEYEERGRFESWLFRITMNRVRDEARRARTRPAPPRGGTIESLSAGTATVGDAPAEHARREEGDAELDRLRRALSQLGEADRTVIELRHHAQLNFKDIARHLDEPLGTVLARHHRALRKLKELMERSGRERAAGAEGRNEP